jgi:hypothetical protein
MATIAMRRSLYATTVTRLFLLCVCSCVVVDGFIPTNLYGVLGLTQSSKTHQEIMEAAIKRAAKTLMSRYPDQYEKPSETLRSSSYKQARKQFLAAVALPDSEEPDVVDAHFDDESFAAGVARLIEFRQNVIAGIRLGSTANMENARKFAGRALHGLHDFYSHSNWVEMGNTAPYPELGLRRIPTDTLAAKEQRTCVDCRDSDGDVSSSGECRKNIVPAINDNKLLTSGYYSAMHTGIASIKCRHGGNRDKDEDTTPVGGINKDSESTRWSPHSCDHHKAANMAIDSTVEFLESIRVAVLKDEFDVMADEDFAEFLGIPVGSATTLCFVVDTTGSMSSEIAAVRDFTIGITQTASTSTSTLKPSDYVLSPFNDPYHGPLFKTTSAATMIAALTGLTATGGGDYPELAFHGLQSALNNVRVGSTCYMFTDAAAKDYALYPVVLSLAVQKKVRIVLFYTGWYRRRRSANSRVKRAINSYYEDLTRLTGGSVLSIRDADIGSAVDVVGSGSGGLEVVVFTADDIVGGFEFHVDETMSDIFVRLSDSSSSLKDITFTSPAGEAYSDYTVTLDLSSVKQYNMTSLEPGLWRANVSTTYVGRTFSVEVTARSLVSFTYELAKLSEGSHPGYIAITGNPIAGTSYYVVVDVFGATDPITDDSTNSLSNITAILLVSQDGTIVSRLAANELSPLRQYVASTELPSTGIRVAIEGYDVSGHVMWRFDESVVSAVVISLDIQIVGNSSYSLFPGQSVNVSVNVTSVGTSATWYIRVSDTETFYVGSPVISVTLSTNESKIIYLEFRAPTDAGYGLVSTATVSAGTSSASSVENYKVVYMNVKSPYVDNEPPACVIDSVDGVCSDTRPTSETPECLGTNWSVRFHVQDVGSGLSSVSVKPLLTSYNYSLEVDTFSGTTTNETIYGTYSTTCCYPNVTVYALDGFGNLGSCFVYNDRTPPTCTAVSSDGVCRSSYDSEAACKADTWSVTFNVFDAGSGLNRLTVDTGSTDYTLEPASPSDASPDNKTCLGSPVTYGSVTVTTVTFNSSCCHTSANITVDDISGNMATCSFEATISAADGCARYPCFNGGTCSTSPPRGQFMCICLPGFTGPHCQHGKEKTKTKKR